MFLFGLPFLQSAFYMLGLSWSRYTTLTFFTVLSLLVLTHICLLLRSLTRFNLVDACVISFVSVIVLSLSISNLTIEFDYRLWGHIIFSIVMPYVTGRCISKPEELTNLRKFISIAGLLILPIMLVDRMLITTSEQGRFPFFGINHSPLFIGALLSATLICHHSWLLSPGIAGSERSHLQKIAGNVMLCLLTVFLIWTSARGWVIAGIVGSLYVTLAAKHVSYSKRIAVQLIIFCTAVLSFYGLSILDPKFGGVYSIAADTLTETQSFLFFGSDGVLAKGVPILGEASCLPFAIGDDSIAMRWVLYQEAVTISLQQPLFGIGAGAFGLYSCSGPNGFPHSTILQVISELGVLGGVIFFILIILTGHAIIRERRSTQTVQVSISTTFVAPLLVSVLVADQIYGNFFMATAFFLLTGIVAKLQGERGLTDKTDV